MHSMSAITVCMCVDGRGQEKRNGVAAAEEENSRDRKQAKAATGIIMPLYSPVVSLIA